MAGPEIRFAKINSGGPTRVRKQHERSKAGCDSCKKRKVKCDEKVPICSACERREEHCVRGQSQSTKVQERRHNTATSPSTLSDNEDVKSSRTPYFLFEQTTAVPAEDLANEQQDFPNRVHDRLVSNLASPLAIGTSINFLQLRLFHHFENVTSHTLVFGSDTWKKVLPLALEHEHLMHAILMIAASHLSHLEPTNKQYKAAELEHLSSATEGIRTALSDIDYNTADAVFAGIVLLYNQAWTSCENTSSEPGIDKFSPALETDFLIPLGAGLKGVITQTKMWSFIRFSSIFTEAVAFSPKISLNQCAQHTVYPQELEESLRMEYLQLWPQNEEQGTPEDGTSPDDFATYMKESARLIPVVSVLKLANSGVDLQPLKKAIVRYLFTWPILLGSQFVEMTTEQKDCTQLLFYHYYEAVEAGLPTSCWWAQKRMNCMVKTLEKNLAEKGIKPQALLGEARYERLGIWS